MRHFILAALAAALILPATAGAAGTVTGGPAKVAGGYTVFLHAEDRRQDELTITMQHGPARDLQTDSLVVTSGVQVAVRGGSATIRGSLGSHGSIDLRLRGRKSPARKLPKGCTGSRGSTWTGRLVGTLRLRLPNGRDTTIRSLPGSIYIGDGALRCGETSAPGAGGDGDGDGGAAGEPQLMLVKEEGDFTTTFIALKRALTVTRTSGPRADGAATVMTMSSVSATGRNLLSVGGGGASATVKAAGRFTGTGTFAATMTMGDMATGPLTGTLQVRLVGAPVIDIAGDPATLLNADKG